LKGLGGIYPKFGGKKMKKGISGAFNYGSGFILEKVGENL
jgi:hypothetical protein